MAIYCLDVTGGEDAALAFARLVLDPDSQVRAAALEGLDNHPADVIPQTLLQAFDQSRSPTCGSSSCWWRRRFRG